MTQPRYITAGGLIDGSGDAVRRNVFLEIKGGIIAAIGPAAELPASEGAAVDEYRLGTIVPPLVDCTVSLAKSPSVDQKVRSAVDDAGLAQKRALAAQQLRYCYSHGVLGVAESNDHIGLGEGLPTLIPEGSSIDIRTAGRDFLRIVYSESIDAEAPYSRLNREDLESILQQEGDKKAIVVANGVQPVAEALAAGCDAIEQGYGMGEDNLKKMAEKDVLWIPSVLRAQNAMQSSASGGDVMCRFSMRYVAPGEPDPGAEAFWKKMLAGQLAQLRLARELGVKTAVGTGAGSVGIIHGESVVEEIKLFIRAGWSLAEAVMCASVNGAGFFGMENRGVLAVGRNATFLVARGTVQQLPRKLAFLENVYVDGEASF
jgi:imidazolonepropionase-like amidohydrolase